ncbi:hypothetical protein SAMN05444320_11317 [Streptoalloteichus hindustanus]|uniref:Uncharacterized protein n=1 Tax=Streptoalloteichus hindustanus TaxID=2017 RepID=A0A1M5M7C4_STRHI|nr:hypothetical protein SAMN05444320_11317 [Streptoalloteichus hindustanus]
MRRRLTEFLHFDEYNVLPESVTFVRLQTAPEDELHPKEQTALSLLHMTGVDSEEFTKDSSESRRAALERTDRPALRLLDPLLPPNRTVTTG